jgi:hypothetical protein
MKPPAIPGLSESLTGLSPSERTILARLRRARLLAPEDPHQPGQLDTHPLFRDYFGAQLRNRLSEAWRECNQRLYDHYRALAPRLPESIREMEHGAAVFSGHLRLPGRLVARHTARSVSARIQHPTGQFLPAVKSARFLHKQPTPPSTSSGRVEIWRGSLGAPFPDPAHQTGRADLPHPAFGQGFYLAFAHGRLF